jgi:anti-sigma B factor antagonist
MDDLQIQINKVNNYTMISLAGRVNFHTYEELDSAIARLLDEPVLCLDMEHIDRLSSSGLGVLVSALEEMQKRGSQLVLFRPSMSVRKTIDATGFLSLFTVIDSLDELDALKAE